MNFGDTDVLCIYGFEGGTSFPHFEKWLHEKGERYLIFLEDDEGAFLGFLNSSLSAHPQVHCFLITRENEEELFKQISWDFIFLRFSYLAAPSYLEKREERAKEIFGKMAFFQSGVDLLASDYSDFGAKILQNIRKNSAYLPLSYSGEALAHSFPKIPAIICGGGPSLAKNIHLLPALADRALLFAGGSSLKILSEHKIIPHFAASLDPDPPYERFLAQTALEVPFFYQSRLSSDLLSLVQAPLLWISDNGGYPLERGLSETLLSSHTAFDAGWNVGNFCSALSLLLGCDPIIFVGMDLSCGSDRVYAPGVEEPFQKEKFLLVQGQNGKSFYSRRDWVMAAEWTEGFALKHRDRLFINATEGGIGFKGMLHLPLAEVAKKHLTASYDLKANVHSAIENLKKMAVTQAELRHYWQHIDESFGRAENYCDLLLASVEASYPQLPYEKGEYVLNEFELEEELVALKFLIPLWNIWGYVFKRKLSEAFAAPFGERLQKLLFYKRVISSLEGFQGIINEKR